MAASRDIEAGRAFLRLLFDGSAADAGMQRFERRLQATGRSMVSIGLRFGSLSAAFAAPFTAAIKIASDAQETLQKFNQLLGSQRTAADSFLSSFAGGLTQSKRVAQDTFASLFAQFRGLGAEEKAARIEAEKLTQAIADFESFNNLPGGESLRRVLSALAGEIEPLRKSGIDVSDQRVDRELKSQGVQGGTRSIDFLEKAFLRSKIILDTLAEQGVLGDVQRTFEQFANQVRSIVKEVDELAVTIGSAFLPILESVTPTIRGGIEAFEALAAANPNLVVALGLTAGAFTILSAGAVGLGFALNQLAPLFALGAKGYSLLAGAGAANAVAAQAETVVMAELSATIAAMNTATVAATAATSSQAAAFWAEAAAAKVATQALLEHTLVSKSAQLLGFTPPWWQLPGRGQGLIEGPNLGQPRIGSNRPAVKPPGGLATLGGALQIAGQTALEAQLYGLAVGGRRGTGVAALDPNRIVDVTLKSVRNNKGLPAGPGLFSKIGSALASAFPTFIAAGGKLSSLIPTFSGIAAAVGKLTTALVGLFTFGNAAIVAVVAGLAILGKELVGLVGDWQREAQSNEDAIESLERYGQTIEEVYAKARSKDYFAEARKSAVAYQATLKELAETQAELAALESAGQGDSDAAKNARERIAALKAEGAAQRDKAERDKSLADPINQSEEYRKRLSALAVEIQATEQASGEAKKSNRDDVAARLKQRAESLRNVLNAELAAGDPAADLIAKQLQNEVEGGTATDPEKRLREIKSDISGFIGEYERQVAVLSQGDPNSPLLARAQSDLQKFRNLAKSADATKPSPIGGRDEAVLGITDEGKTKLAQEADQRRESLKDAELDVAEARRELIEDDLQRELAGIEAKRQKSLEVAREQGLGQQGINLINEAAALQGTKARRDAEEKAAKDREKIAERTRQLLADAQIAEIDANPKLTDLERRLARLDIERKAELGDKDLNAEQRGLVNRRFDAERKQVELDDRRRRIQEARQLDISSAFEGSVATALQLGPDASIQRQQLDVLKRINQNLDGLRPGVLFR